ncbi:facilitated trehalose transporter Tret1-like isoform X2 [Phymastichus coffea]|uniref:facilitated trehalose transporter Tret1-like isoform X2 n=1 Tax=Phymastichus coffea TaxID=108790 RepID=UPI00273C6483|nr:facilitated trehalose transporter Tret1-like isoform X2 [Phymastichus coffea]
MTDAGSRTLQFTAAAAACGAILGWTSPILPKLSRNNPISSDNQLLRPITTDEGSWIGSLVALGVMFGSFASGYLGEWLGRKRGLLMSTFPFIVGWLLVGTAKHIGQIYAGRFILGLGVSIPFTLLPMYIGEISEASIRGALGSFLQLFITFGFLFSYSVGPYISYTIFWLLCTSLHIGFYVCFMIMPESPYFLLSKGREVEAAEALARFRGKSVAGVEKEIEQIQVEIDEAYRVKTSWADVFKDRVNRKAIVLTSILMTFQEFMGIDVVLFYTEDIFRNAGTKNTAMSAIIIGVVQMLSSVLTPLVVDRSGRKILLIISSVGSGITVGILGTFFYLQTIEYDLSSVWWVPLATLVVYMIAYSIGWGPIPWTVMGEMFAPAVKPKASSICVCAIWTFSFLTTKFFTNVEKAFGTHTGFWFFSFCCAINIVFIVMFFPETKGKTLSEIQKKLSRWNSSPIANEKTSVNQET